MLNQVGSTRMFFETIVVHLLIYCLVRKKTHNELIKIMEMVITQLANSNDIFRSINYIDESICLKTSFEMKNREYTYENSII